MKNALDFIKEYLVEEVRALRRDYAQLNTELAKAAQSDTAPSVAAGRMETLLQVTVTLTCYNRLLEAWPKLQENMTDEQLYEHLRSWVSNELASAATHGLSTSWSVNQTAAQQGRAYARLLRQFQR